MTAQELWRHLVSDLTDAGGYQVAAYSRQAKALVDAGCLSRRILKAVGPAPTPQKIKDVYGRLCRTLEEGGAFDAAV